MNLLAEAKLEKLSPKLLARARNKAIDGHKRKVSPDRNRAKADLRRKQGELFAWGADRHRGSLSEQGVVRNQVRQHLRGLRGLRRSGLEKLSPKLLTRARNKAKKEMDWQYMTRKLGISSADNRALNMRRSVKASLQRRLFSDKAMNRKYWLSQLAQARMQRKGRMTKRLPKALRNLTARGEARMADRMPPARREILLALRDKNRMGQGAAYMRSAERQSTGVRGALLRELEPLSRRRGEMNRRKLRALGVGRK